jgi:hypothetical protein
MSFELKRRRFVRSINEKFIFGRIVRLLPPSRPIVPFGRLLHFTSHLTVIALAVPDALQQQPQNFLDILSHLQRILY